MRKFTVLMVVGAMCAVAIGAPGNIRINQYPVGNVDRPVENWDPIVGGEKVAGGRYLASWQGVNSGDGVTTQVEMNGQWFTHAGAYIGPEFQINTTQGTNGNPDRTGNALDAAGNAIVSWGLDSGAGVAGSIRVRSLAPGGGFNGPEQTIAAGLPTSTVWGYYTAVDMNAAGDTVVTWEDIDGTGNAFAQRMSSTGVLLGTPIVVNTTGSVRACRAAVDGQGNFTVTYRDSLPVGTNPLRQVYVAKFNYATGAQIGAETVVGVTNMNATSENTISCNEAGDTVVNWVDNTGGPVHSKFVQITPAYAISVQKYGDALAAAGAHWMDASVHADGSFTLHWQSGQDGSGHGQICRRFNSDGGASEDEWIMNSITVGRQQYGNIGSTPEGDSMIGWSYSDRETLVGARYNNCVGAMLTATEPAPTSLGGPEVPGAPRRGDVDRNDYTDFSDILVQLNTANWLLAPATPGAGWSVGDVNNDNITDFSDILICLNTANWLQGTPPTGVPEPATMSLLALGALALLKRRRR